ncbi:hypothetical protein HanXRQr2_Chr13g0597741 [Helianthus annuus]|uniref:Uncharacterized protein n=1 Tax=Helianthus annuus TaxID=4232 RepID=A0A9K3ELK9_HELAN|nr:hypothetical protein HanXRQr2_Chr13g0597741 [Helianthus annuus]KAJ0850025.1 hypothetical protein HanPSC8_Chr13g0575811 [Helianthus annuus]
MRTNYMQVVAFEVRLFVPRIITITVTSSWYFLLRPAGTLINSSALKPARTSSFEYKLLQ